MVTTQLAEGEMDKIEQLWETTSQVLIGGNSQAKIYEIEVERFVKDKDTKQTTRTTETIKPWLASLTQDKQEGHLAMLVAMNATVKFVVLTKCVEVRNEGTRYSFLYTYEQVPTTRSGYVSQDKILRVVTEGNYNA